MKEIKFNRNYKKLHNQTFALLLDIRVAKGKHLDKEFIEYDTENEYKIEPEQKYLILYFIGDSKIPFTTLRKFNVENVWKYEKNEHYRIVVEEKKEEEPLPNHWVPM